MQTYGDNLAEQAANPLAKQLMAEVACGNEAAFQWMWDFWCFTHVLDDLVDRDKTPTHGEVALALAQFVTAFTLNPFFLQHRVSLYPLIISAINRWLDGDALDASGDWRKRMHAEVVRCGDIDIFLHVAFLAGGWDHMRSVSERVRSYDPHK